MTALSFARSLFAAKGEAAPAVAPPQTMNRPGRYAGLTELTGLSGSSSGKSGRGQRGRRAAAPSHPPPTPKPSPAVLAAAPTVGPTRPTASHEMPASALEVGRDREGRVGVTLRLSRHRYCHLQKVAHRWDQSMQEILSAALAYYLALQGEATDLDGLEQQDAVWRGGIEWRE